MGNNNPALKPKDIKIGRIYEGKRPRGIGIFDPLLNDRQVVWMGIDQVQYDSPTVKFGQKLPVIPLDKFLKWAGRDVTDEMPKGEWRSP